jgi:hypothetical protein
MFCGKPNLIHLFQQKTFFKMHRAFPSNILSFCSRYYKRKKQETFGNHTEESHYNDLKGCL